VGVSAVPIPVLQGRADVSAFSGQRVTTRGVVTAALPGLRGFALQDEAGDDDEATSDGLFVYTGQEDVAVEVGERLEISGVVKEHAPVVGAATLTELVQPRILRRLGRGAVAPTTLTAEQLRAGALERFEGMLVRVAEPLTVHEHRLLGRYGQVLLAPQARRFRAGDPPAPLRGALVLDDARSSPLRVEEGDTLPHLGADGTLRIGDEVGPLVGILDSGRVSLGNRQPADVGWRLQPVGAVTVRRVNARPASPPQVGGGARVAAVNLLNFFTTFADGDSARGAQPAGCLPSGRLRDCRGARNAAEFARQRDRLRRMLLALDADLLILSELQRDGGDSLRHLAGVLNEGNRGTYRVVEAPREGAGSDAIQVAMLYRAGAIAPVGEPMADADRAHSRPPLAQAFRTRDGEVFTAVAVHFKSRNCDRAAGPDQDQGDGQGCYGERRRAQARALVRFVERAMRESADPHVLVAGDFNAYEGEAPLRLLAEAGLRLIAAGSGADPAYSYLYDGVAGALDHAFVTPGLAARVTGAGHWHINADEPEALDHRTGFAPSEASGPWRASDHDPLLIGLGLRDRTGAPRPTNPAAVVASNPGGAAPAAIAR
jgi:predicted extracellular nuclease